MMLDDYRCECGRLLFKGSLQPGCRIEIKCKKCGEVNVIDEAMKTENVAMEESCIQ